MLSHGDELSRTQAGNNNAYCQDNELTWLDWELDDERRAFLAFVRRAFALRRANPLFARRAFFDGAAADKVVLAASGGRGPQRRGLAGPDAARARHAGRRQRGRRARRGRGSAAR